MIWLTWRQFRTPAITVYAGIVVLVVILADDPGLADDSTRDRPATSTAGRHRGAGLRTTWSVTAVVPSCPPSSGSSGARRLIARELEAGTHRLVWNQSVTRTRWLAVKLGLIGLRRRSPRPRWPASRSPRGWLRSTGSRRSSGTPAYPPASVPGLFDSRGIARPATPPSPSCSA